MDGNITPHVVCQKIDEYLLKRYGVVTKVDITRKEPGIEDGWQWQSMGVESPCELYPGKWVFIGCMVRCICTAEHPYLYVVFFNINKTFQDKTQKVEILAGQLFLTKEGELIDE